MRSGYAPRLVLGTMECVSNEATNTVHRPEAGATHLKTVCSVTYHVPADHLRSAELDPEATTPTATKCGRCFDDGGGY